MNIATPLTRSALAYPALPAVPISVRPAFTSAVAVVRGGGPTPHEAPAWDEHASGGPWGRGGLTRTHRVVVVGDGADLVVVDAGATGDAIEDGGALWGGGGGYAPRGGAQAGLEG